MELSEQCVQSVWNRLPLFSNDPTTTISDWSTASCAKRERQVVLAYTNYIDADLRPWNTFETFYYSFFSAIFFVFGSFQCCCILCLGLFPSAKRNEIMGKENILKPIGAHGSVEAIKDICKIGHNSIYRREPCASERAFDQLCRCRRLIYIDFQLTEIWLNLRIIHCADTQPNNVSGGIRLRST